MSECVVCRMSDESVAWSEEDGFAHRACVIRLLRAEVSRQSCEGERKDKALQNICVHTAHNPDASRDLLTELLGRCLSIAKAALVSEGLSPEKISKWEDVEEFDGDEPESIL